MSAELAEYTLVRQLEGAERPTSGVQAYLFRGALDYKLVIWNVDSAQRRLILKGALQKARAVDVVGQAVAAGQPPSDELSFPFSTAPIYVSGLTGDLEVKLEIR
jgi:hypothetical protein